MKRYDADSAADVVLVLFFARLLTAVAMNPRMLMPRYGRYHRLLGMLLFGVLIAGMVDARLALLPRAHLWVFDALLSCLGFAVAYSAARDFGPAHRKVKNTMMASGVLDKEATVTYSEMIEHCFYQLINLAQILYLHALPHAGSVGTQFALAFAVVVPWRWRRAFPINSFSANYASYATQQVGGRSALIRLLYRLKKWQYLLYKHALLHGLNASLAMTAGRLPDGQAAVQTPDFRLYWMCLNVAYVMEFFMQTLVKRQYMSQSWMLALQQLLMAVSTLAALRVPLRAVSPSLAALSFALNFARRGRELSNGALVITAALVRTTM